MPRPPVNKESQNEQEDLFLKHVERKRRTKWDRHRAHLSALDYFRIAKDVLELSDKTK